MTPARRALACASVLCCLASCATARAAAGPGGVGAPAPAHAGGTEYGARTSVAPAVRPVLTGLSVPASSPAGTPPVVRLAIREPGVGTVKVTVTVSTASGAKLFAAHLGWVHTSRTITVSWRAGATLSPGSYRVIVDARDHRGMTLLHGAHSAGIALLRVIAPPAPPTTPVAPPPTTVEPGVLTPAQTVADNFAFPVAGPHNFGGPENRFGAPRAGHIHEGQDVLTAEGTPVVAPFAGTIVQTANQPGGAGYYVVEHTTVGFDFMFAHCEAGSFGVAAGQAVATAARLCLAGQTGDATTPHLHFEMWVGGWQAATGHPIDPLPYLEAWPSAAGG